MADSIDTTFNRKDHWENVYADKMATDVSWYQQCPESSLSLIKAAGVEKSARIIDIGGGASTLVDYLLAAEYQNISVLDIAQSAIEQAKDRLGQHAGRVNWIVQDITRFRATEPYDVWQDRAVFHFLTDEADRFGYISSMSDTLKPGAHVIVATFDLDGPEKCSGLEIVRFSPETLSTVLGEGFQLMDIMSEAHATPAGKKQNFVYCRFKRV